jgi:hypothetical protein
MWQSRKRKAKSPESKFLSEFLRQELNPVPDSRISGLETAESKSTKEESELLQNGTNQCNMISDNHVTF